MNETTPAGGTRSEATYLDANGAPLPSAVGATEVVIREYAGNIMIRRTYMELDTRLPQWTNPGTTGTEPEVFDFAKNTWDVYTQDDGNYRLVTTLTDLMNVLGIDHLEPAEQRDRILTLMTMPSWQAAPADLKADTAHWLATR